MNRCISIVRLSMAVLAVVLLAASAQAGQKRVQISHTMSLESPWHRASLAFADHVNSRIGDRYKVEVYGNGVLCQRNWKIMFEMTQNDESQIGIESATTLGSLITEIGAVNLPFLFDDPDHVTRFLEARCPAWEKWFNEKILEQDLVIIAATSRPFRQLNNNKRLIKTPEDMSGLIFRVPSTNLFVKIFEALDAKPVPLPIGEVYTAIQLGTVSGEDNSIVVQHDFKTHEVAKNFTICNYIADLSALFINRQMWEEMSDADKAVFLEASKIWEEKNEAFDQEQVDVAMKNMTAAGVDFHVMTPEEKVPFKKLLQPVYEDFTRRVGEADMAEFLEYVEKTRK